MRNSTNLKNWVVISVFFVALAAPATTAAGGTIYVDGDARNGWIIHSISPGDENESLSTCVADLDSDEVENVSQVWNFTTTSQVESN